MRVYVFFSTIGVPEYIPWKVTDALPPWAKAPVWEQALWRWIMFSLALLVVLGALIAVGRGINAMGAVHPILQNVRRLVLPASVSLAAWCLEFVADAINITGQARVMLATILGAILVVTLAWSVVLIGELLAEIIVASPRFKPRSVDEAIVRLASRLLALVCAILVSRYGAQLLGLPVVPLLAGLGVGGLALALAAQPTIENLIAALTIHADRPVRVGDFCRFGDTLGIVEKIGMRSTHLRHWTTPSCPCRTPILPKAVWRTFRRGGRSGITRGSGFAMRRRRTRSVTSWSRSASFYTRTPESCPTRSGFNSSASVSIPWT